jgi:CBS domain-containing protein
MQISTILARKGDQVHTVDRGATLAHAADLLARHGIGALVVLGEGGSVAGILSERDIVRELARSGGSAIDRTVADVMTTDVQTCEPSATVDQLMQTMTERRIRHVPIVDEGRLAGIVSIGDVVKSRLVELELQTEAMEAYVTGTRA